MAGTQNSKASDFDGHGPIHRRRLRPTRVLIDYDFDNDPAMNLVHKEEQPTGTRDHTTTLSLPFETQPCNLCAQETRGNYLLYDLNNAVQHFKSHHREMEICYLCDRCKKAYTSKDVAVCNVPKCPGPVEDPTKNMRCEICKQVFRNARGLAQHERIAHPALRNEEAAIGASSPTALGGFGIWENLDKGRHRPHVEIRTSIKRAPKDSQGNDSPFSGKNGQADKGQEKGTCYKALVLAYYSTLVRCAGVT